MIKKISIILSVLIIAFSACEKPDPDPDPDPNPTTDTIPVATFNVNPLSGTTQTNFSFDASGCTDKETPTSELQVRWDYENDDTWDTEYSTTKVVSHIYTIAATYTVVVEVIDTAGNVDTFSKDIVITELPQACPDIFTDERDGKTYSAVEIGDQCWMAENLNVGNMISSNSSNNSVMEKYCYNNSESNCDNHGGLYRWDEMMQYTTGNGNQGICPAGWHLPTDTEWMMLEVEVGMLYEDATLTGMRGTDEGTKLQQGGSSGFDALLGGYRNGGGNFSSLGSYGTFFTASLGIQSNMAWSRYLFNDNGQILRSGQDKTFAFSVRCVKD